MSADVSVYTAILPVQTGWPVLDIIVYLISGGAFVALCYLIPRWIDEHRLVFKEIEEMLKERLTNRD